MYDRIKRDEEEAKQSGRGLVRQSGRVLFYGIKDLSFEDGRGAIPKDQASLIGLHPCDLIDGENFFHGNLEDAAEVSKAVVVPAELNV